MCFPFNSKKLYLYIKSDWWNWFFSWKATKVWRWQNCAFPITGSVCICVGTVLFIADINLSKSAAPKGLNPERTVDVSRKLYTVKKKKKGGGGGFVFMAP